MKGDFTRFTHDPDKHYSGVLRQQGRVDLDADWNEYVQIQDYLNRTETQDIIGRCGVPNSTPNGFKIRRDPVDNSKLEVMPGRIYVNGILCQLEETKSLVNPDSNNGIYLAYLDVWQRHITAVEDPDLPEIALGGVDTTTRIKTEWQVRFEDVSDVVGSENLDCQPFCCDVIPWKPSSASSTGKMAARAEEVEDEETVCEVKAEAGYRGLENRLYRIEIHTGGNASQATFKWSRDDGAVVFPIQSVEPKDGKSKLTLKQLGKDEVLTLHVGDWVEVLGDETELECDSGILAQVASEADGTDLNKGIVVLTNDVSALQSQGHLKIRRWDQKENGEITLDNGAVPITEGSYISLEDGVEVCFNSGTYLAGDYWLIPARTTIRDVIWPKEGTNPVFESRHGIEHYFCALALIVRTSGVWGYPQDCRRLFPPLTDIKSSESCCISVKEGENIQQAVDSAIADGGGCLCLCSGVHMIDGPLVLNNAQNLTIHGENLSTILQFNGMNNYGEGGIILRGCSHVTIADMLILGDNLSALISTRTGAEAIGPTRGINLHGLTLFNSTLTDHCNTCAVQLGNAEDINIDSCKLIAENGIISLFGDSLPEPVIPNAGGFSERTYDPRSRRAAADIETDRLSLSPTSGPVGTEITVTGEGFYPDTEVQINFADTTTTVVTNRNGGFQTTITVPEDLDPGDYIVTAVDASGEMFRVVFTVTGAWQPIELLDYGIGVHKLRLKDTQVLYRYYGIWTMKSVEWHLTDCDIRPATKELPKDMNTDNPNRVLHEFISEAISEEVQVKSGMAINALIWRDCTISGCHLEGAFGMNVCTWLGGHASGNTLTAGKYGFNVMWLHDTDLSGNIIQSVKSIGFSFAGGFRAEMRNNQVRGSGRALQNSNPAKWLNSLGDYLSEVVRMYPVQGTEDIPNVADFNESEQYEMMVLWVLLEEACRDLGLDDLRDSIQDLADTFENMANIPVLLLTSVYLYSKLNKKEEIKLNLVLPIIAINIEDNDFEAEDAVILLRNFIPIGGMKISGNRLHTLTGQAVCIKAVPVTVNPHIIIIGWRVIFELLPTVFQVLKNAIAETPMPEDQKSAIVNIIKVISRLLLQWGIQSESFLETDYRIQNNNIRSQRTAIMSNLFELAIQNNYVTLQESQILNDEIGDLIDILSQFEFTQKLAIGMRQRSAYQMSTYTEEMKSYDAETMQQVYLDVAEASCRMSSTLTSPVAKMQMMELNKAANEKNMDMFTEMIDKVGKIMESYIDTCGIWVKGAGCRIVSNHVLVPIDADRRTWAQGGVRFWDDEGTPIWMFVFLQQMLKLLKPDLQVPSLLSVTETLIDNNEILGGIGHGVEINGIKNMPMGIGLIDLKIRGNQIRDMVGAGVMFDEGSMAIGVDIEDNRILDCGSMAIKDFFASQRGGLIVRNVAFCRVHNNRIRCNSNLANNLALFAIDMRTVYGLTLTDNYVQHNEISGYQLFGETGGNQIVSNLSPMFGFALMNLCGAVRLSEMYGEVNIQNNDILFSMGTGSGLLIGNIDSFEIWREWMMRVIAGAQYVNRRAAAKMEEQEAVNINDKDIITNASIQNNHFESLVNQPFIPFLLANLRELNLSGNNVRVLAAGVAPGIIQDALRGVISNNILDTLEIDQMSAGVITGNCSNVAIAIPASVTHGLNTP